MILLFWLFYHHIEYAHMQTFPSLSFSFSFSLLFLFFQMLPIMSMNVVVLVFVCIHFTLQYNHKQTAILFVHTYFCCWYFVISWNLVEVQIVDSLDPSTRFSMCMALTLINQNFLILYSFKRYLLDMWKWFFGNKLKKKKIISNVIKCTFLNWLNFFFWDK